MKSLENVLFGCTFWSVFSSPDRGYRPVRFTLSTNLTAHIVGTVVLGVPTTSPALQSGVRMGLWPIRTPPGCEFRWSFESPTAVLWVQPPLSYKTMLETTFTVFSYHTTLYESVLLTAASTEPAQGMRWAQPDTLPATSAGESRLTGKSVLIR